MKKIYFLLLFVEAILAVNDINLTREPKSLNSCSDDVTHVGNSDELFLFSRGRLMSPWTSCERVYKSRSGSNLSVNCTKAISNILSSIYVEEGNNREESSGGTLSYVSEGSSVTVGYRTFFSLTGDSVRCTVSAIVKAFSRAVTDTCSCGQSQEARIVGGVNVTRNQYPWTAAITWTGLKTKFMLCGGSLISNTYVLTSARCVSLTDISILRVRLGALQITNSSDGLTLAVERIVNHPGFNFFNYDKDFALVQIPAVDFDALPNIRPICLPITSTNSYAGENATVAAWGRIKEGGVAATSLQAVTIPIVANDVCKKSYVLSKITDNMMCAGGTTGEDACQGDSGAPLIYDTGSLFFEQVGLVSFGIGCGRAGNYGGYARVSSVIGWISSTTESSTYCTRPS